MFRLLLVPSSLRGVFQRPVFSRPLPRIRPERRSAESWRDPPLFSFYKLGTQSCLVLVRVCSCASAFVGARVTVCKRVGVCARIVRASTSAFACTRMLVRACVRVPLSIPPCVRACVRPHRYANTEAEGVAELPSHQKGRN